MKPPSDAYKKNPFTLVFYDKELEKEFRHTNQEKGIGLTRLAVGLGLVLYMSFTLLDVFIIGVVHPVTLITRLLAVPLIFGICLILTFTHRDLMGLLNLTAITTAQAGHFVLIATGLFPPEYCFSITYIILLYLFTFSRVPFETALVLGGIIFLGTNGIIIGLLRYPLGELLTGNFFLISIHTVCITAGYTMERYLRREFIAQKELKLSQDKSDELLLNILPRTVAQDLKERGIARPVHYKDATVLFTDFVQFTTFADSLGAGPLVATLDRCFSHFDEATKIYNLEKIKTIGDSYMLAGGLPIENHTHAVECVLAGLTFLEYVQKERARRDTEIILPDIRIGINTGPVIAGVLGSRKFAFDIFGRTVNIASRVESCGAKSRVNISETTYARVKDFFRCTPKEIRQSKNGESYPVYGIKGIHPELSQAREGTKPNLAFWKNLGEWGLTPSAAASLPDSTRLPSGTPAVKSPAPQDEILEMLPLMEDE